MKKVWEQYKALVNYGLSEHVAAMMVHNQILDDINQKLGIVVEKIKKYE